MLIKGVMSDLLDVIDWFGSEGSSNAYWTLDTTAREEVKQYRRAHKERSAPPPAIQEEHTSSDVDEDTEGNIEAEVEQLTVEEGIYQETEVNPDANEAEEEQEGTQPPKRRLSEKQQRYQDYLKIARHALKEENPNMKTIPHKMAHEKCQELLKEDGWM
jgi:hypothetical protein